MYHLDMRPARFILVLLCLMISAPASCAEDVQTENRKKMIELHIKGRGVRDERVLKAMSNIPREQFVPAFYRSKAYVDNPLPIGEGQTISQPYVVAWMTEALALKSTDKVLEIGTGSGYQAAVLAEIADEVYTIEIREKLAASSATLLKELGYENIDVKHADGYFGWPEHAPFDAIIITAAVNHIPPPLIRQLKDGGRLILPLGPTTFYQMLTLAIKEGEDLKLQQMGPVNFVPMTGEAQEREE
jgi:protein-L-isoaspartate(D-aspartate) O-methyltransferase